MTDNLNVTALLAEANNEAVQDQTKVTGGGGEYSIPAAGKTLMRFVGYVEVGKHPTTYQGKVNGSAIRAKLFFELLGPKHMVDDGNGGKRSTLYIEDIFVKTGEKAAFRKLFMKMRGGDEAVKNMAQLLGRGYIIEIVHNTVKGSDGKETTYANIRNKDGEWTIAPPVIEDPSTGEVKNIPIPAPTQPIRLLLWNNPSKLQWDSLFIDGTSTRKVKGEDGKETEQEVSKNWIQTLIVKKAIDFENSPLADILAGLGELNLGEVDEEDHTPEDHDEADKLAAEAKAEEEAKAIALAKAKEAEAAAAAQAKADAEAKAKAETQPEAKPAENVDDIFAELGIK
jgi:hypothetical protein